MSKIEHQKRYVLRNLWGNSDHKHYGKYLSFNKNSTITFCASDDLQNIVPWELYGSNYDPVSSKHKSPYYLINRWGPPSEARYGKYLSFLGNTVEFCAANDRNNWVPWQLEKVPNTTNQYYVKNRWTPPDGSRPDERYGKYLSFSGNTINLCDAEDHANKVPWEFLKKVEITQQQLNDFKALHSDNCCRHDNRIKGLTFQDVLDGTEYHFEDWNTIDNSSSGNTTSPGLTKCQNKIAYVIYDAICLAVGAYSLRNTVHARAVAAVGGAALPVMSSLETIIRDMTAPGATNKDQAYGVYYILKTIYNGGHLGAVFSAFTDTLTWWDMIFYGITGTATVIAALATDGAAFAAEIALELVTFEHLAEDSVKAVNECS
jgi:hypothetical protein